MGLVGIMIYKRFKVNVIHVHRQIIIVNLKDKRSPRSRKIIYVCVCVCTKA